MDKLTAIDSLFKVLDELRLKCPWDRKQTMDTLKNNTIEECYELIDAINNKDYDNIKEELGDLLLHIAFYSKIAEEQQLFTIKEVAQSVTDKLIYRHPHVFGDTKVDGAEQVVKNWEELKSKEKSERKSIFSGVPTALPALIKSYRIQEKAAAVGFDWQQRVEVWDKVKEEIAEFETEVESGNEQNMEEEFGDILFTLVNSARLYGIDPEQALEKCNRKFIKRFSFIEQEAALSSSKIKELSFEQMNELWNKSKQ